MNQQLLNRLHERAVTADESDFRLFMDAAAEIRKLSQPDFAPRDPEHLDPYGPGNGPLGDEDVFRLRDPLENKQSDCAAIFEGQRLEDDIDYWHDHQTIEVIAADHYEESEVLGPDGRPYRYQRPVVGFDLRPKEERQ